MAEIIDLPHAPREPRGGPCALEVTSILWEAALYCQTNHKIGLIVGPAGIGKTTAWQALANGDGAAPAAGPVIVVTCNRTTTTAAKTLALVQASFDSWRGFSRSKLQYQSPADRVESILNDLRRLQPSKAGESGPLLIIDEAQHLRVRLRIASVAESA